MLGIARLIIEVWLIPLPVTEPKAPIKFVTTIAAYRYMRQ